MIIAIDWLTRWAEAKAVNDIDSDTCSSFVYEDICCRYSVLEWIWTDHGRSFDNAILDNLDELLRINHHMSTLYYPQSNGLVERLEQTFKDVLKRTIQDQIAGADGAKDQPSPYWAHLVPSVLYAYRSSPHAALGLSPAELLFGRSLHLPRDYVFPGIAGGSDLDHKTAILHYLQFLTDVIPTLRVKLAPKVTPVAKIPFAVTDWVWVRDSKFDVGFSPVFAPRWKGPFFIKNCFDRNVYRLRTDPAVSGKRSTALALPINGSRLRLATEQELAKLANRIELKALHDKVDESIMSCVLPVVLPCN